MKITLDETLVDLFADRIVIFLTLLSGVVLHFLIRLLIRLLRLVLTSKACFKGSLLQACRARHVLSVSRHDGLEYPSAEAEAEAEAAKQGVLGSDSSMRSPIIQSYQSLK